METVEMETAEMETGAIPKTIVVDRVKRLRSRIRRLEACQIELHSLEKLLAKATAQQYAAASRRFGPTKAVFSILRTEPLKRDDVVDALQYCIVTKSNDARRVLMTTIGTLERKGRLKARADGVLEVTEQRKEVAVLA